LQPNHGFGESFCGFGDRHPHNFLVTLHAALESAGRFAESLDYGLGALHFGQAGLDVAQPRQIGLASFFAQGQLGISRANFEHTIGRPAETLEVEPLLPSLPKEEDGALGEAHKYNPSLDAARYNVKVANFAVQQAIGALLPQLSVNGTYQYSQNNPNFGQVAVHELTVLGNVTVPIYQGGAEDATVRQAKEQRGQAELVVADTERQVVDATRSAWDAYQSAAATIASTQAQVDANKVAFQGVKLEQQVGSRTIIEVLNAEQELFDSEVSLVAAKRDTAVAAYQLLSAMGTLTAEHLSLHVHVYDPVAHYDDDAGRWVGFGD